MAKYSLAQLKPSAVDMPVTHPVLGDLELTLKVQGGTAPTVRQKSLEAAAWLQTAAKEQKPLELVKLLNTSTDAVNEAAGVAILGWSDDEAMGGPYTPEYAVQLMKNPDMAWLREQVTAFVGKEENFFRRAGE